MKWVYDLTGAEAIIKDMPVYAGTALSAGELMMLGTTGFSAGADAGVALVTAGGATAGSGQGVNAVGIILENATTAGTTGSTISVAAAHNVTTGLVCYGKVIINPFAVYRAEVGTTTGQAITAAGSSTTQQFVCTAGATTGVFNGAYVYFSASAGPNYGQLRRIVTSASAATMVLDAVCLSAITSADKATIFNVAPGQMVNQLGVGIATVGGVAIGQTSHAIGATTNLRQVETFIDRGLGNERLTNAVHGGGRVNLGSVQAKITRIYQDLMMKDHAFGVDL
jgi:hypothetical protein